MNIKFGENSGSVNLGGVVPASGVAPLPNIEGATVKFLGHGHFLVTLDPITQTGSDVTTLFEIPFSHELTTITVKHVDASLVDSVVAETINFKHRYGNLWFNFWTIVAGISTDTYGKFTDSYMLPGQYQIITNTTNGHILYVQYEIYVMQT